MTPSSKGRKLSPWNSAHLNVVRSVATIAVVAEHTLRLCFLDDRSASGPLAWFVQKCSRGAGESVMVFFVLSGFFIANIVLRSRHAFTWKRYLIDRFSRLYIVLLPALLFTAGIDLLTRHTVAAGRYLDHPLLPFLDNPVAPHHTLAIFFGNLSFLQLVTVPAFGSDLPLWSLSSEFWYYMMFPFACLAMASTGRWQKALYAIGFVLWLGFFPHRMVKYFLIWLFGAFICWSPMVRLQQTVRMLLLWLSTGLVAALLFLPQTQSWSKWTIDCSFSIAFSAWLFLLVRTETPETKVRAAYEKAGAGLAACSYSIYVTHFPLMLLLRSWRGGPSWQLTPLHATFAMLLISGLVLFGWTFARATEAHTDQARKLLFKGTDAFATWRTSLSSAPVALQPQSPQPRDASAQLTGQTTTGGANS